MPAEILKTADLLALVSLEDSFPLVGLEAALQGTPTICFQGGGGMPEFVSDDAGFAVAYLDVEEMSLQIASLIGFAFTLFGVAALVYVVGRYLIQGTSVPGFPFLASMIAIFSGAQLLSLGIIGEYLARIHHRTMNRPTYGIQSETVLSEAPGD